MSGALISILSVFFLSLLMFERKRVLNLLLPTYINIDIYLLTGSKTIYKE